MSAFIAAKLFIVPVDAGFYLVVMRPLTGSG